VGQSAAGAHLEHHDDAFPGETTSQTGAVLNADCVEEAVACPCDFTLNAWSQLGIESDITCFVNGTIAAPEDSFMGTQNSIGTYITGLFTRDLVETARDESDIEQVEVFYFHNVVAESLYRDPRLTEPVKMEQVLASCSTDTSLLLVSDAGAARGYRPMDRIRATTQFLLRLKQRTTLLAWLNPMPMARWEATSAQIIAHLVPMLQMDFDGLSNAIDIVRGQPLHHYR
jgi:hypothetical protein